MEHPLQGSPVKIAFPLVENREIPFESSDLTGHRVLVLSPHPDDESLNCAGALILHRKKRDPVKVIFLTDGSALKFRWLQPPDTISPPARGSPAGCFDFRGRGS